MLRVISIQTGLPQTYSKSSLREDQGRSWTSGIFKAPVSGPVKVRTANLEGDGQANLQVHGGPDRAVLMFAASNYAQFGREVTPGFFGENLTIEGPDETEICLGDRWGNERVTFEVSQPRIPCINLARRQNDPTIVARVLKARAGGWYCRVIQEGTIEAGTALRLMSRPHPEWTVCSAIEAYLDNNSSLLVVQALSALWRERLASK